MGKIRVYDDHFRARMVDVADLRLTDKDGGVFNADALIERVIQLEERLEVVEAKLKDKQKHPDAPGAEHG